MKSDPNDKANLYLLTLNLLRRFNQMVEQISIKKSRDSQYIFYTPAEQEEEFKGQLKTVSPLILPESETRIKRPQEAKHSKLFQKFIAHLLLKESDKRHIRKDPRESRGNS